MQTMTAFYSQPLMAKPVVSASNAAATASGDNLRASVAHLLSRAYMLPCSAAAQAFTQLVPPTSRFHLALEVLFPLLDSPVELQRRILVSYILYSLYAPYPISINPFRSALAHTFTKEKEAAVRVAASGDVSKNEQLIWVLWKILRGDGSDIGPFTPNNLATSPVPPKLRPANLSLNDETSDRPKFDPFGPALDDATLRGSPDGLSKFPVSEPKVSVEKDKEVSAFSEGMSLVLAARERVLSLAEQRTLVPLIPQVVDSSAVTSVDLAPVISTNPAIAQPLMITLLSKASADGVTLSPYLEVLRRLPPTLSSFDLVGRLLRDPTIVVDPSTGGRTTIADLVRTEVLGWFIREAIGWLDHAEQEEKAGNISDDRFAKGLQNLCRFFTSLIKLGMVDPGSDADSAEMAHFALRNARFEDANALYRIFATGSF